MTVRKRTWVNRDGSQGEAWVVAYTDQAGKRRLKSFDKKREADYPPASSFTGLALGLRLLSSLASFFSAASAFSPARFS
jgi:integrase